MEHRTIIVAVSSCAVLGQVTDVLRAQPIPDVCAGNGGPTICVRFDNFVDPPNDTIDFQFDVTTDPSNPSVELINGRDAQATLLKWRVWSQDALGNPANIGNITAFGADDYDVTVLDDTGASGAANVATITLNPLDDHFSSIAAGSRISGDLTGQLFLKEDSLGTGGRGGFTIDGNATGSITVPTSGRDV